MGGFPLTLSHEGRGKMRGNGKLTSPFPPLVNHATHSPIMKHLILIFCLLISFPAFARTVTYVVDGDTVHLDGNEKVRLIGVDAPEYHKSLKMYRDAKKHHCTNEEIHALGEKALDYAVSLLAGKEVDIKYDAKRTDMYGRTLGYLYLKDGTLTNLEIVKQGYGIAYIKYPFKYKDQFVAAEEKAKTAKRGLWKEPKCLGGRGIATSLRSSQ